MKVKDLIEQLIEMEMPEAEIIISSDPEGNGFSPFSDWSVGIYDSEEGQLFDIGWSAEDADMDEEEWDEMLETKPRSVVFWP